MTGLQGIIQALLIGFMGLIVFGCAIALAYRALSVILD